MIKTAVGLGQWSVGTALVGVLAWGNVSAQTAAPQQPTGQAGAYSLQVNAQIVVLDVVVLNSKGELVENLSKDDFTVFEDKTPETILTFEHNSPPAEKAVVPIESTKELDQKEPNAPVTILVMDEVVSRFEEIAFMRDAMKKYLSTQGDTLRQPTMLVAVNTDRMMILQDYTTSKKQIVDALSHHEAEHPWRSRSWQGEQFNAAVAALTGVAHAEAGHPGHKNMIWIGRGFPAINWTQLAESPVALARVEDVIQLCVNELRDSRVTLYTIDPAGVHMASTEVDAGGTAVDAALGGQWDFEGISRGTGGIPMHGYNDLNHLILTSVRNGESFYTLSYRPVVSSQNELAFRNIRVVMKDPNLHATTRSGYFTRPTEVSALHDSRGKMTAGTTRDLSVATQGLLIYDGVPFEIVRDAAKPDSFSLKVKVAGVTWEKADGQSEKATLTLAVESFDKKGKVLNHLGQTFNLQVPALASTVKDERTISLPVTIATAAPAARVRFVLRSDKDGKIGADNVFLIDKKEITDPATGRQLKEEH